jgi:hypothetical protein
MKTYSINESNIGIKTGSGIAGRIADLNMSCCDTKEEYERKFKKLNFIVTPYETKKDTLR